MRGQAISRALIPRRRKHEETNVELVDENLKVYYVVFCFS
jgi:hypothetical protein